MAAAAPLRFDPLDPAFVRDPYPLLARLRADAPVHRSPAGAFVLTRHADIAAALADERLGNAPSRHAVVHARNRDRYVCADVAAHILPFLDRPRHELPRRLLGRAFAERLRQRPPDVAALATGLLDGLPAGQPFDAIADYATPLAVAVIAALLGLDPQAPLRQWSLSLFHLFAGMPSALVREQVDADLRQFRTCVQAAVAARELAPQDDLISDLLRQGGLEPPQLVDNVMLLCADGIGNVDRAIGNAVHLLLAHADQRRRWQQQPQLLPALVDECLRFESPGQFVARIAGEDLELHGVAIGAGAVVLLVLGAANRDPAVFAAADAFDAARAPNPHLAFGQGRHACLGGRLVELELAAALPALFVRRPALQRVGEAVEWLPRPGHRWLARLPVR